MFRFTLVCSALLGMGSAGAATPDQSTDRMQSGAANASVLIRPFGYSMSIVPLDYAFAINNSGAIVGRVGGNAAMYSGGVVTILPGKAGYTDLEADDISNSGMIVGSGMSAGHRRALYWQSAASAPLDMSGLGRYTFPQSINSQGTVVGYYYPTAMTDLPQGFRWTPSTGMVNITPSGAQQAQPFDVSDTGYVAGQAWYTGLGQQVVRWYPNGAVGRITGPGFARRAMDNGSVFGSGSSGQTLWDLHNTPTLIGPAPQTHFVQQRSSADRWVGYTLAATWVPWTSVGTGAATYLPMPAGAYGFANDVNSCGTVLGNVVLADGTSHPVIWSRLFCDTLPPIFTL
ncbi:MAG TPA: hypothetical protein VKB34_17885 [Povalibacter sp.]|nr:hypothetical protein [Povalibacter sp.]